MDPESFIIGIGNPYYLSSRFVYGDCGYTDIPDGGNSYGCGVLYGYGMEDGGGGGCGDGYHDGDGPIVFHSSTGKGY